MTKESQFTASLLDHYGSERDERFLALAFTSVTEPSSKNSAHPNSATTWSRCNAGPRMIRGDDGCESHYSPRSQLSSPSNEDRPDWPPESLLLGGKRYTTTITRLDLSVYYSTRSLPLDLWGNNTEKLTYWLFQLLNKFPISIKQIFNIKNFILTNTHIWNRPINTSLTFCLLWLPLTAHHLQHLLLNKDEFHRL